MVPVQINHWLSYFRALEWARQGPDTNSTPCGIGSVRNCTGHRGSIGGFGAMGLVTKGIITSVMGVLFIETNAFLEIQVEKISG
jgi:hypothetical protein